MSYVEIKDGIYRIDEIRAIKTEGLCDILVILNRGRLRISYDSELKRNEDYELIKRECLHCGNDKASYCEKCYQNLITKNLEHQFEIGVDLNLSSEIKELEELKIKYENISRELLSRTNRLVEITKENNELKEKFNKIKEFIKVACN